MKAMLMLAAQAIFAVLGLRQLIRHVLPELPRLTHPSLIADVWGPVIIIGPMLFLTVRIRENVSGPGWLALGGPLLAALLGVGMALVRCGVVDETPQRNDSALIRACLACGCASALVLLLGAAHDLTLWMGQCSFAVGAVLLWINTPTEAVKSPQAETPGDARAGLGMTAAASCAVIQGLTMLHADAATRLASGAVAVAYVAIALGSAARIAGPSACMRMALWSGALGVFFGLGLISLAHMVPEAIKILRNGEADPVRRVACGFGVLSEEAAALAVVSAMTLVIPRLNARVGLMMGVLISLAAMSLAIWRLVSNLA